MGLSSNVLWHQTNKSGFYGIIRSKKLLYSYSLERIIPSFRFSPIAFPMISVSDIPLSEIGNNKWSYGNYCIGFKKSWGEKVGFSPVWYCSDGSRTLRQLDDLLKEGINSKSQGLFGCSMFIFAHMKLAQAPLKTKGRRFNHYRFYDEREWRVVPYITETDEASLLPFLTEEKYIQYKKEHKGNSRTSLGIDFQYDDIKCVVVEDEDDISKLKDIAGESFRIFTKREVIEDFVGVEHNEEALPSLSKAETDAIKRHVDILSQMYEERKNNG